MSLAAGSRHIWRAEGVQLPPPGGTPGGHSMPSGRGHTHSASILKIPCLLAWCSCKTWCVSVWLCHAAIISCIAPQQQSSAALHHSSNHQLHCTTSDPACLQGDQGIIASLRREIKNQEQKHYRQMETVQEQHGRYLALMSEATVLPYSHLINQSINYIPCLWDSSGESIDNKWEHNIH